MVSMKVVNQKDAETENKEDDKVKAENCDVENVDEKKEKTDELSGNNGANDNQDEDTKSPRTTTKSAEGCRS